MCEREREREIGVGAGCSVCVSQDGPAIQSPQTILTGNTFTVWCVCVCVCVCVCMCVRVCVCVCVCSEAEAVNLLAFSLIEECTDLRQRESSL